MCDRVPNLQLLRGADNIGKSDKLPMDWLDRHFATHAQREVWLREYDAFDMPANVRDFPAFFAVRRERMRTRLSQLLGAQENAIVTEMPISSGFVDEPDPGNEVFDATVLAGFFAVTGGTAGRHVRVTAGSGRRRRS